MAGEIDTAKELRVHQAGYHRFLGMMKWGTILSAITGFLVVLIIAK